MAEHGLIDGALQREQGCIVAKCKCGWTSAHFTSFAASAAFMDHREQDTKRHVVSGSDAAEDDDL